MQASVIDYPKNDLDSEIWDLDEEDIVLKENIKNQIMDVVLSFLFDTDLMEESLDGVYIHGSILTNQYNSKTDIDCQIVLKDDPTKDLYPGLTGEDIYDLNREILHGIELEGTNHPLNCTVSIGDEIPLGITKFDPVYNVMTDEIENPPWFADEVFDPDEEFTEQKDEALDIMQQLDKLLTKTKLDAVDILWLDEAVENVRDKGKIKDRLDTKLEELGKDLTDLVAAYHEIKDARTEALSTGLDEENPHSRPGNVIFKIIEKYEYITKLRELKVKIKEDGIETTEDIADVAEIIG